MKSTRIVRVTCWKSTLYRVPSTTEFSIVYIKIFWYFVLQCIVKNKVDAERPFRLLKCQEKPLDWGQKYINIMFYITDTFHLSKMSSIDGFLQGTKTQRAFLAAVTGHIASVHSSLNKD